MNIKVAKKELGGLLKAGDHVGTITEAGIELSKEQPNWSDRTPQLKIVVKNAHGQITAWLNLRGYKNSSDFDGGLAPKGHEFRSFDDSSEKFLVNTKTNKRVESPERTAKLLENVGNLAYAIGMEAGEDTTEQDVAEAAFESQVGVRVRENANGRTEAYYFMLPSEVKATVKA